MREPCRCLAACYGHCWRDAWPLAALRSRLPFNRSPHESTEVHSRHGYIVETVAVPELRGIQEQVASSRGFIPFTVVGGRVFASCMDRCK